MSSLPTIILVHGAWHTPENYAGFTAALRARGFPVQCPLLPSCDKSRTSRGTFTDDVHTVRDLAVELADAGERILIVMHSYGGAIGTDAVQGLAFPYSGKSLANRNEGERVGGVVHLLYLCAYILVSGTSVWDIVREAGFDTVFDQYVEEATEDGSLFPIDPAMMFFGGDESVPQGIIDDGMKLLVRFPKSCLTMPTTWDAWRFIPSTYVLTQKDYGVPRIYQDIMVAKVRGEGIELRTKDFDTCHSIFISREREMVELAVEAANDSRNADFSLLEE
ncbi:alpha/beta-hydrolase [Aspergillus granulosus]|uniref:Alpha/beta-hydrolase n=1 Tax=Aspergillus granulosus TaxID=176169 RepID=A0ABR4HQE7_9EURO